MEDLATMSARLEQQARVYVNLSAREYLASLNLSRLSPWDGDAHSLDTSAGLAWVVVVPVIYFSSVSMVMTLLVVLFRCSETNKVGEAAEGEDDVMETALNGGNKSGGGVNEAERLGEARGGVRSDNKYGVSSTKGAVAAFVRGYVNSAGEVEGASRASGASKGSVRSLGVLTELDGDRNRHRPWLHSNPPSAPTTLTVRGVTTFNLLARRRLSKSIDELKTDATRAATGLGLTEWTGAHSSLEMNVTTSGTRLTLLGSDLLALQADPGVNRRSSSSTGSCPEENVSRDSLRASMELHQTRGSGLRADDLYGQSGCNSGVAEKRSRGSDESSSRRRRATLSSPGSASGDNTERDGGKISLSFLTSDDAAVNDGFSAFYAEPVAKDKIGTTNKQRSQPQRHGFGNPIFSDTAAQLPNVDDHLRRSYEAALNLDSCFKTTSHDAGNSTGTFSNSGPTANTAGRLSNRGQPQEDISKVHILAQRSESAASFSSTSDSPAISSDLGGRPLSLGMLSSWQESLKNEHVQTSELQVRKHVGRKLFATTPQVSLKREPDTAEKKASRSVPHYPNRGSSCVIDLMPYGIQAWSGTRQNLEQGASCLPCYSSSNSTSQKKAAINQDSGASSSTCEQENSTTRSQDNPYFWKFASAKTPPCNASCSHTQESSFYDEGGDVYPIQKSPLARKSRFRQGNTNKNSPHSPEQDSPDRGIREADISAATSCLSTAVSVWTSTTNSDGLEADQDQDESSIDSTVDSLSSSIAPFHAKRLDKEALPRAKYPLPGDECNSRKNRDDLSNNLCLSILSDDASPLDLSQSLDPNPGSLNQSLGELSADYLCEGDACDDRLPPAKTHSPTSTGDDTEQPHTQTSPSAATWPQPEYAGRQSKVAVSRRRGSLLELAHQVFSGPPYGVAAAAVPLSPGQSFEELGKHGSKDGRDKSESMSEGVVTGRRVSAEQRLSEFGFIRAHSGRQAKFVVNPSPGKFSERMGSVGGLAHHISVAQKQKLPILAQNEIATQGHALSILAQDKPAVQKQTMLTSRAILPPRGGNATLWQGEHDRVEIVDDKLFRANAHSVEQSISHQVNHPGFEPADGDSGGFKVVEVFCGSRPDKPATYIKDDNNNNSNSSIKVQSAPNLIDDTQGEPRPSVLAIRDLFQQTEHNRCKP